MKLNNINNNYNKIFLIDENYTTNDDFGIEYYIFELFKSKNNINYVIFVNSFLKILGIKSIHLIDSENFYRKYYWKVRRVEILIRDNYLCQVCLKNGIENEANVIHHILDIYKYPEYSLNPINLLCTCRSCHKKLHKKYNSSFDYRHYKQKLIEYNIERGIKLFEDITYRNMVRREVMRIRKISKWILKDLIEFEIEFADCYNNHECGNGYRGCGPGYDGDFNCIYMNGMEKRSGISNEGKDGIIYNKLIHFSIWTNVYEIIRNVLYDSSKVKKLNNLLKRRGYV